MNVVEIRAALPFAPGQKVGLLGGSFDPPHLGHRHISQIAKKRFGLDQVVWLVSPGNPMKRNSPAMLSARMSACDDILRNTHDLSASDIEYHLGTRYTSQTVSGLCKANPHVSFVWLMGADNLVQFHRWENWKGIATTLPIGIIARPDQRTPARHSIAARILRNHRIPEYASQSLTQSSAPHWCFVNCPMVHLSSTQLRQTGAWEQSRKPYE